MTARGEERGRRSQRELQRLRTQARLLDVRMDLRVRLGRDPTKAEIARAAGVTPGLVTRYWDTIGIGEVRDWYLQRLKLRIARRPAAEDPLVALGRVLVDFAEHLSPEDVETLRHEVTTVSASPEEEALRYRTLNLRWRPVLAAALAQRAGRTEPTELEDRCAGRFIVILLDTAARWQQRDFQGPVSIPIREAVAAAIPDIAGE